ncbi:hypothetical protein [cf. Phormidesmis sp. LEGE 11477]|nr:hypothetical protein [cf. Phormidesmis sp. LEGE 11477]
MRSRYLNPASGSNPLFKLMMLKRVAFKSGAQTVAAQTGTT